MTFSFVYWSYQGRVSHSVTFDVDYLANRQRQRFGSKGPPIGNGIWAIKWRHLTTKGAVRQYGRLSQRQLGFLSFFHIERTLHKTHETCPVLCSCCCCCFPAPLVPLMLSIYLQATPATICLHTVATVSLPFNLATLPSVGAIPQSPHISVDQGTCCVIMCSVYYLRIVQLLQRNRATLAFKLHSNSAFSSNFGTTRRWWSRDVELLTTRTFELSSSRHLDILRPSYSRTISYLCVYFVVCILCVFICSFFLQYFDTVGWVF